MSNKAEMTVEDYLAVLQKESERRKERLIEDPDVYTTKEIEQMTGLSNRKALEFMKELMADGLGKPVFTTRKDTWGRLQPNIPAMRLIMEV
jgi:hypothetical protein